MMTISSADRFRKKQRNTCLLRSVVIITASLFYSVSLLAATAGRAEILKAGDVGNQKQISLAGSWSFCMDDQDVGLKEQFYLRTLSDRIELPGSMLGNGKGHKVTLQTDWTGSLYDSSWYFNPRMAKYRNPDYLMFPFFLTPLKRYVGPAWYQKKVVIPADWNGKDIQLFIERAHFETMLWVDQTAIGMQNSLSAPHLYNIGAQLTPGPHTITIRVDNRIKDINPGKDSHSLTDQTQGNWNGMVGRLLLIARPRTYLRQITTYPDIADKSVLVKLQLHVSRSEKVKVILNAASFNTAVRQVLTALPKEFNLRQGDTCLQMRYSMGGHPLLWDEFHPALYRLRVNLNSSTGSDEQKTDFGMRSFKIKGTRFLVNGREVFLRGTVENCDFPLTGYAPMDLASWVRIFKICKSYGLNQMRFHSYSPPLAAFQAADFEGIYLHIEGPSWANHGSSLGDGKPIDDYIYQETNRINDNYGNHPSFCMLAYGNEPRGSRQVAYLNKFVDYWKAKDARHVYTGASTGMSWPWVDHEAFVVRSGPRGLPWVDQRPGTEFDHRKALQGHDLPYIAHEVGQYCAFPDFSEIKKYTGGHKARNFELFQQDLRDHHMGDQAAAFLQSSGKLQLLCYKAEIEAALRTPGFAGFELLSLNDYSGQGTALVGVLNVFWESKGYTSPATFSRFCAPVVPLARFSRFVFRNNENFKASIEIANFGENPIESAQPHWRLEDKKGNLVARGDLPRMKIRIGNGIKLGSVDIPLNEIPEATELKFSVTLTDPADSKRIIENDWPIWVYPYLQEQGDTDQPAVAKTDLSAHQLYICHELDSKAKAILATGGKVFLLCAGKVELGKDVCMHFLPVFWNTSWFKMRPPHTTGIYLDPAHAAFKYFPTEDYSNMQWWSIVNKQQVMNLVDFPPDFKPLVQPIDTWFMNRRLGLIFEANVAKGKLMVCSADLETNLKDRPAAAQLLYSLKQYMTSAAFQPEYTLSLGSIEKLFVKGQDESYNSYSNDKPDELRKKSTIEK